MEMIEKVARAIFEVCSVDGVTLPWESISEDGRALHRDWAKAAIEAMREPTDEMISEGTDAIYYNIFMSGEDDIVVNEYAASECLKAMVGAALKGKA